jgi:quercetin dioxygenase-like cupin family protein
MVRLNEANCPKLEVGSMDAVVLMPGEGEVVGGGPASAVLKATSDTTNAMFSMSETTIAPGFAGPPPHSHKELTDTFYVLEGTLTIRVGDRTIEAPAGAYVLVPPGVVHTFSNTSEEHVRFLNLNSPGGWESYLRDVERLMAGGRRPDPDEWRAVMSKYDFVPAG